MIYPDQSYQQPTPNYSQPPSFWEWLNPFSGYNRRIDAEIDDLLFGDREIEVPYQTVQVIPQPSWSCREWLEWLQLDFADLARNNFKPLEWKVLEGNLYFRNHDGRVAVTIGLAIKGQNEDGYWGDKGDFVELDWVKS